MKLISIGLTMHGYLFMDTHFVVNDPQKPYEIVPEQQTSA